MPQLFTYGQVRLKVERDLHLEARNFIKPDEMLGLCNEAIDEAEAEIHSLYEDYFLNSALITFASGTEEYDLPSDIYGHKIRRFLFENGSERYTIHRLRDWKKFEIQSESNFNPDSVRYSYFITNASAGNSKIVLVPVSTHVGAFGKLWYIRQVAHVVDDASVVDVPEFANFIMQYMKWRIYEKRGASEYMAKAEGDLERQRRLMVGTLEAMVADANDEVEPDMSHYEEHN